MLRVLECGLWNSGSGGLRVGGGRGPIAHVCEGAGGLLWVCLGGRGPTICVFGGEDRGPICVCVSGQGGYSMGVGGGGAYYMCVDEHVSVGPGLFAEWAQGCMLSGPKALC